MKTVFAAAFLYLALCACGPREIGQGMSADYDDPVDATAADAMRQPITGISNTQRMLYYCNRPDVMENVQNWKLYQYRRAMGLNPSPEDPAYRAVPKQRSPFRQ